MPLAGALLIGAAGYWGTRAVVERSPMLSQEELDYFVAAYSQWLDQGVDAFRIDTIAHMPHAYWKQFSDRIREQRPGLFMFSEHFAYEADEIAPNTWPENGSISVLDFPGKAAMNRVFADGAGYAELESYLHLESGLYQNPYELMIFYDNHDMDRMNADANGFIDAHNWMFTSRGIPVVYYGSEIGFRAGTNEHTGNRDYFGQENVELAKSHPVREQLARIANLRKASVALQRGLQVHERLDDDVAVFFRIYQKDNVAQTALVALNKGDAARQVPLSKLLSTGTWHDAFSGEPFVVSGDAAGLDIDVPAHGVRVLLFNQPVSNPDLLERLERLQVTASRTTP